MASRCPRLNRRRRSKEGGAAWKSTKAKDVADAIARLRPAAATPSAKTLRKRGPLARKTERSVRQGEWFFVPAPTLAVPPELILRNEPIQRGRGNPHRCQELYREGGELVYVHPVRRAPGALPSQLGGAGGYANGWAQRHGIPQKAEEGLTQKEFDVLQQSVRKLMTWRRMQRGARVFVRGRITHPDHATVALKTWHEVLPNLEVSRLGGVHVVFLD